MGTRELRLLRVGPNTVLPLLLVVHADVSERFYQPSTDISSTGARLDTSVESSGTAQSLARAPPSLFAKALEVVRELLLAQIGPFQGLETPNLKMLHSCAPVEAELAPSLDALDVWQEDSSGGSGSSVPVRAVIDVDAEPALVSASQSLIKQNSFSDSVRCRCSIRSSAARFGKQVVLSRPGAAAGGVGATFHSSVCAPFMAVLEILSGQTAEARRHSDAQTELHWQDDLPETALSAAAMQARVPPRDSIERFLMRETPETIRSAPKVSSHAVTANAKRPIARARPTKKLSHFGPAKKNARKQNGKN